MTKPYALFMGIRGKERGGWSDFVDYYADPDIAYRAFVAKRLPVRIDGQTIGPDAYWFHVVDVRTGELYEHNVAIRLAE